MHFEQLYTVKEITLSQKFHEKKVLKNVFSCKSDEVCQASSLDASRTPPCEVFRAHPTGRRPLGRPRTCWRDYVSRLAWERLGISREELDEVAEESKVWLPLLRLLPP